MEYRNRVVNLLIARTGWTVQQVINVVGDDDDLLEMMEDEQTPDDVVRTILHDLAEADDSPR